LFARGGHDGPGTFETGDPNLKIERSNALEATVRTKLGPVSFEGALWGASFSNYIYGDLTGRTCDDDGNCVAGDSGELKELNYAQRDADFWGFEAKASAPLLQTGDGTLSLDMLADYVRATFGNGFGNVPRIQPFRMGGGLSWSSPAIDASFLVLGVGDQNRIGAFETATPGYVDVSAQAVWRPFPEKPGLSIALVGQNLADQIERDAVALNRNVVVMPGRNIRIVLRQAL
jgi:iron complex outermembrane receptor protein